MSKEDSEQVSSSKSDVISPIGIAKAYHFCIIINTLGVHKPFNTWVKKTQAMNSHSVSEYHANSLARMSEFVKRLLTSTHWSGKPWKTIEK